ncbi:MAG: DUF503 domain-containing protein [Syntrophomonas sp.]
MYIMYGYIELYHPNSSSLKEKRMTVQSITARMRKRFNVSMREVGHQELWQRSALGFSAVSGNYSDLELIIEAVKDTLNTHNDDFAVTSFESRIVDWDSTN